MTASTATDKRPVSLTKRQWHLIAMTWADNHWQRYANVMERAVPLILSRCEEVRSMDDIVAVPGSLGGWQTVVAFCKEFTVLQWNVLDDIEKQIKVYIHGG
jgi:hypothetical protein